MDEYDKPAKTYNVNNSAASPDEDAALVGSKGGNSKEEANQRADATESQLVINLITGGLGTGIFTLPWSTAGASIMPAILIVAVVLVLNAWTISIIVEAAERHQTFDLGGLLARLPGNFGRSAQFGCNACVWFSLFLCLVSYTIVAADCVQSTLFPLPASWLHRCFLIVCTSLVVGPLCFLDQRRLAFTSIIGVAVTVNIFVFIGTQFVYHELEATTPPHCFLGLSMGSVAMISAMMQAVIVQMCVLPMYAEMKDRSPQKFRRVVAISFTTLFFIFAGFSVFGYLAFGPDVQSNVLLSLPGTAWGHVSRLFAALAVVAVYPIMMNPMIAPIRNSRSFTTPGLDANVVAGIATCCVIFAATVTAFFVTDLGYLNVVNGAMSLGVFVALAPSFIGLSLLGGQSKHLGWRVAMVVLAVVGVLFSILGLVFTDNYAPRLHQTCRWGNT